MKKMRKPEGVLTTEDLYFVSLENVAAYPTQINIDVPIGLKIVSLPACFIFCPI